MTKRPPQPMTIDEILRFHIDNLRRYGEVYPGAIRDALAANRHEEWERRWQEENGEAAGEE